jgi:N-acetylglutamate synthase-like GNAT family acetyltransferase
MENLPLYIGNRWNIFHLSTLLAGFEIMITIREFLIGDEKDIGKIIYRNFDEVNSKDYPQEIIETLKASFTLENIISNANNREMFVAQDENQILGTASLGRFGDDFYALTVFINPDYHKQGIGKKLMGRVEKKAEENGAHKILVPASITAERFYLNLGYDYLNGQKELDEDMNIKMIKTLNR